MRNLPQRRLVKDKIKQYREWRPLMRLVSIAMQDDGFVGRPIHGRLRLQVMNHSSKTTWEASDAANIDRGASAAAPSAWIDQPTLRLSADSFPRLLTIWY